MAVDLSHHFSYVSKARTASAICDMYNSGFEKGQANLAAGLLNPALFPIKTLGAEVVRPPPSLMPSHDTPVVLKKQNKHNSQHVVVPFDSGSSNGIDLTSALQYGHVSGYPDLLDTVKTLVKKYLHRQRTYEGGPKSILTNGSTDGMSKCLELFTNTWAKGRDPVSLREGMLVEKFTYPAALSQAEPRGLNIVPVEVDKYGMIPWGVGGLQDVLQHWDCKRGRRPHVMYTVTIGNNPTGSVMPIERRKELYQICCDYDIVVIEDEPYWFLEYEEPELSQQQFTSLDGYLTTSRHSSEMDRYVQSLTPSYTDIDTDGRVVRLDTFSKMFAPGCRLGWMTAQPAIIERFETITEAFADQPSGFVQVIVAAMLHTQEPNIIGKPASLPLAGAAPTYWQIDGWLRQLSYIRNSYQQRLTIVTSILEKGSLFPRGKCATRLFSFDRPAAGMFLWLHMRFALHPLWNTPLPDGSGLITGKILSEAMLEFVWDDPYLVSAASGATFAANEQIRRDVGWQYCRLCFAAEGDDRYEDAIRRFVAGVQGFFRMDDPARLMGLLSS